MLAIFCLRLAWGMIAALLLLPAGQVHPRFFRVQYLVALGLLAIVGYFFFELPNPPFSQLAGYLLFSLVCCVLGSIVWSLDRSPLAGPVLWLATIILTATLSMVSAPSNGMGPSGIRLANSFTAAALLGGSMSAMLMGHSYLVAPAMSLTPLMRLLAAMGVALVLRVILAGVGLFQWTDQAGPDGLDFENMLLLSLRWALGFVAVLVLGWMAWESARIRSTQSATGILYVVVIVCFLGELTSQFLTMKTGFTL